MRSLHFYLTIDHFNCPHFVYRIQSPSLTWKSQVLHIFFLENGTVYIHDLCLCSVMPWISFSQAISSPKLPPLKVVHRHHEFHCHHHYSTIRTWPSPSIGPPSAHHLGPLSLFSSELFAVSKNSRWCPDLILNFVWILDVCSVAGIAAASWSLAPTSSSSQVRSFVSSTVSFVF